MHTLVFTTSDLEDLMSRKITVVSRRKAQKLKKERDKRYNRVRRPATKRGTQPAATTVEVSRASGTPRPAPPINAPSTSTARSVRIDALDLGPRTVRTLNDKGIRTLGDVADRTEGAIRATPGIGEKTVSALREALASRGLAFKKLGI